MKLRINKVICVLVCFIFLFNCNDETPIEKEEKVYSKEEVIEFHKEFSEIADKALLSENSSENFEKIEETYKNNNKIERIEFDKGTLIVKYKNGGMFFGILKSI